MVQSEYFSKLKNKDLFKPFGLIDGVWTESDRKETFAIENPSTGEIIANMPEMKKTETIKAVVAAEIAFKKWKNLTPKVRCSIVRKWHDLILDNIEDLALIMTLENGKPLSESKAEIVYASWFVDWFSEEGKRSYGKTIPSTQSDKRLLTIKQPIGVCALITPWNFPAAMITRKVAPAIVAGCTVIVKPAEQTPLSATALAHLANIAGIPKGVINILVSGDPTDIGEEICANPVIKKISFTGSTEVGKYLLKQAAGTVKKTSMELGGNAPLIIFNDANIDSAVEGAIASKYRNSGQTCVCANRIFVQSKVYDEFAKKLSDRVSKMKLGDGLNEGVDLGPLIDKPGLEKVSRHLEDAVSKGAEILIGGKQPPQGGLFFEPTVLKNVTKNMVLFREETFGPIAPLLKFEEEDEVIRLANDTNYGLAGYIYTQDINRAWLVAERLEFGMVAINAGIFSSELAPFGGVKESGLGREGGSEGLDEYLETKYMCIGGM